MNDAVAKAPTSNELDRIFSGLQKQAELISMLTDRLNTVSHRTPKEPSLGNDTTSSGHIVTVTDMIVSSNSRIANLIDELAI